MKSLRLVFSWGLALTVAVALVTFGLKNSEELRLWFFFDYVTMPLFLHVLVAFGVGFFLGGLLGVREVLRMRRKLQRNRKDAESLQREVDALRNQPLYEDAPPKGSQESPPGSADSMPESYLRDSRDARDLIEEHNF